MRNLFMFLLVSTSLVLTSFSSTKTSNAYLLDDEPGASVGMITGSNTVQVHLSRYGADAGQGGVTFEVDILFNDNNLQTFTFSMSDQETYREDYVYGPQPTAFAETKDVRVISRY